MAHRYSGAVQGSGADSTTLPQASVYAGADIDLRVMEIHAFNTASTECEYNIVRLDTAGTKPAAVLDAPYHPGGPVAEGGVHGTHTVGPTIDEIFERLIFGAAIGAGVILTFGKEGLLIPKGVANGIGIVLDTGVLQVLNVTFVWEE